MTSRYDAAIDLTQINNTHASLVRLTGENGRVLELGAASGHMTAVLKRRGNTVTAIEIDEDAAADLKEIADVTIVGNLDHPAVLAGVSGPFDVVLAGDVLEHLTNPERVLADLVPLLAPDGAIVISVPNISHIDVRLALLQGRFEYQPTGLLDETHLRFFTYESLLSMLSRARLLVTDIERISVNAFESEIVVDRDEVTQEVLDVALAVPEAETYQFVVRAVVDTGDPAARRESDRVVTAARRRSIVQQSIVADGPAGESLSLQLTTARRYLADAERERDEARQAFQRAHDEHEAARAVIGDLQQQIADREHELSAARQELTAACIGEARIRAELTQHRLESAELEVIAQAALADQALLAEILGSRAFRVVDLYRRLVNTALPPGSRRRALVRPLARIGRR